MEDDIRGFDVIEPRYVLPGREVGRRVGKTSA